MHRRTVLKSGLATGLAVALPGSGLAAPGIRLTAAPGLAPLVAPDGPETRAWLFNGTAPGPVIRAQQGDSLSVLVENGLPEPTTVHWHGLRVPVEQDGVPFFSQEPIAPGASHRYTLPLMDAGTFWYHPHINSSQQVGRGLNGVLIVEEPHEVAARLGADREVVWVLDDWRLDDSAQIAPFGHPRDGSHAGRLGNVLTVNGSYLTRGEFRAGERVRLRLCNVANARSFRLRFDPLDPWIVALDGHPVTPKRLGAEGLWLGAGQRADLVVDIDLSPGTRTAVQDDAGGPDRAFEVMSLEASEAAPLRETPLPDPQALPRNPVARPEPRAAIQHELVFDGGAMGGMAGAMMNGKMVGMRELAGAGRFWAINGIVPSEMREMSPLLTLRRGATHRVRLVNRTGWLHPIHLHGHSFDLRDPRHVSDDDVVTRDTVLLAPDEEVEVTFVADNPGKWMLHCHVLEHQESGMMGIVEVV